MDVLEYDRTGPIDRRRVSPNVTAINPELVLPGLVCKLPKLRQITIQVVVCATGRVFQFRRWTFGYSSQSFKATFALVLRWNFGLHC